MSGSSRDVENGIESKLSFPSSGPQRGLTCVSCARRKVKCDRTLPCLNCVKSGIECAPGARASYRPRRKMVRLGDESLVKRLNHYEKLLFRYGASKDELDGFQGGRVEEDPDCRFLLTPPYALDSATTPERRSHARACYVEKTSTRIWVPLSDEILDYSSEEDLPIDSVFQSHLFGSGSSFLLGLGDPNINLANLHPSPVRIFQLWQRFVDNVNPLVKILHVPTVQRTILSATGDLTAVSRQTEALMFSIYYLATTSMTDVDCENIMGEQRSILLSRYHIATKQALTAADWIKSSTLVTLQAFALFLLATRQSYDVQTYSILTGIGIRLAQRLGLHREMLLVKRSPFNAEMGRRLGWQLGFLESKTADLAGVTNTANVRLWDTKVPANLNDSDLSPRMCALPSEHTGATEMAFCLVRYLVGEFQRTSPSLDGSWEVLVRSEVSLEEKEKIVTELETVLQAKVLQHLDRGIALHLVAIAAVRGFTDRLRILCLHPRLYPNRRATMSQHDKEKLFGLCLSTVQRDNWGHTLDNVREFFWHTDSQFPSDAFVYLLHELRCQCTGEHSDAAWPQILEAFENHPEILHGTSRLLVAIRNLTLKAWTARESAYAKQGQRPPEGILPPVIMTLRAQRVPLGEETYTFGGEEISPRSGKTSAGQSINLSAGELVERPGSFGSAALMGAHLDANDLMDMAPLDWTYWNNLLQETEL